MGSDSRAPASGTASRRLGENTRAVHLPAPPVPSQQPLGTPVYRTAAFAFESSAEYAAVLGDAVAGYTYSRIDNPTVDAFAAAVATLESAGRSQRAGPGSREHAYFGTLHTTTLRLALSGAVAASSTL